MCKILSDVQDIQHLIIFNLSDYYCFLLPAEIQNKSFWGLSSVPGTILRLGLRHINEDYLIPTN